MPEAYYIIPMVAGPYSRANPQRPMYVDEIRCNWTGHPVAELGVYVCKVNTTDVKHSDLASRSGVFQLPRGYTWDTPISALPAAARNVIQSWLADHGLPYDANETIGELLMRIINSGLFSLGAAPLDTQFQNLSQAQKDKILALCTKWKVAPPASTETVREISRRCGQVWWHGPRLSVSEY